MKELIEKTLTILPSMNFGNYWDGFRGGAFALYDDKEVYLFNHPKCGGDPYIHFPKDARFVSCTSILFEEVPTAIVDIRYFDCFEDVYSLIVHESFHVHQSLLGEGRFPDEAVGPAFPADFRFIHLRIRERKALHSAVGENAQDKQRTRINDFVTLRNKRIELYPAVADYENRVETIEGPAFFVEYQALRDVGDAETALQRYAAMLLDAEDSHLHIRKNCYSSGLFLCLLLNQISLRWQEDFMHSALDLYHFFKQFHPHCNDSPLAIDDNQNEVDRIIQTMQDHKTEAFQSFHDQAGIKLSLAGTMQAAGFDPMNIVIRGNQALHRHFLKIRIGAAEYFLQGPVLTGFDEGFMEIKSLEIFVPEPPVELENSIQIDGIGRLTGSLDSADAASIKISLT